jgi:hypothetical protein
MRGVGAVGAAVAVIVCLLAFGSTSAAQLGQGLAMKSLRVPSPSYSNQTVTGTVDLTQAAPDYGARTPPEIALESNSPGVAEVPASVRLSSGRAQVGFPVVLHSVTADTTVVITARFNRQAMQVSVLVRKPPPSCQPEPGSGRGLLC